MTTDSSSRFLRYKYTNIFKGNDVAIYSARDAKAVPAIGRQWAGASWPFFMWRDLPTFIAPINVLAVTNFIGPLGVCLFGREYLWRLPRGCPAISTDLCIMSNTSQINAWVKDHGGWIAVAVIMATLVGTYVDLKTDVAAIHEELAVFEAKASLRLERLDEDNKAIKSSVDSLTQQSKRLHNHSLIIRQALNVDPSIADTAGFNLVKELIAARKRAEATARN